MEDNLTSARVLTTNASLVRPGKFGKCLLELISLLYSRVLQLPLEPQIGNIGQTDRQGKKGESQNRKPLDQ